MCVYSTVYVPHMGMQGRVWAWALWSDSPGAVQMQALSLEDSMVQDKELWTEFEAGG